MLLIHVTKTRLYGSLSRNSISAIVCTFPLRNGQGKCNYFTDKLDFREISKKKYLIGVMFTIIFRVN